MVIKPIHFAINPPDPGAGPKVGIAGVVPPVHWHQTPRWVEYDMGGLLLETAHHCRQPQPELVSPLPRHLHRLMAMPMPQLYQPPALANAAENWDAPGSWRGPRVPFMLGPAKPSSPGRTAFFRLEDAGK